MDFVHMEDAPIGENEKRQENVRIFQEIMIRHAFMRKVFFIVIAQLIITSLIIAPLLLHEPTRKSIQEDRGIYWASFILFFAVYMAIICCNGITRSWPHNYMILFVMTAAMAIWVGCVCAHFNIQLILLALGLCILICTILCIFATQTRIDFTGALGIITIFAIALLILSILCIFMPSKGLMWILLISGIILVCIYFVVDIQLMMGGKHKYSLSPEDYILAATLLYVDVIYIFLYILMILGRSNST